MFTFSVVRAPSKYNAILGIPGIRDLKAQSSSLYGAIMIPTSRGVANVIYSSINCGNSGFQGQYNENGRRPNELVGIKR